MAIATVNGTNALHLALLVSGVSRHDEVITQPLTFIATVNAISYIGAKPVFVDVDMDTLGMSPNALKLWLRENAEKKIINNIEIIINKTTGRKISAVVPMHTFGHPCKIDEIVAICNEYKIPTIEDAAESIGSFYKGYHTGTYGRLGVLSFNGNKAITTGGGGMIITNDIELGKHVKHLTTQAKVKHSCEFIHDEVGYNYRMPNINAALGVAQIEQIENIILEKRRIALMYKDFFKNEFPEIDFFSEPTDSRSNYWLNSIFLKNREERDSFLKYMNENGIMTRPAWRLMTNLKLFEYAQKGELTNSEWIEDRLVNLPSSTSF